jgi:fructosamine-3-kinase
MLQLCARGRARYPREKQVRSKVKEILSEHVRCHNVTPSLIHGDLWTGNVGFTAEGEGCIFDPATYYGDREADIAMTMMFGRLDSSFYEGYNEEYPLMPGWERRAKLYNCYHYLNHEVLFGGGYWGSACSIMDDILSW